MKLNQKPLVNFLNKYKSTDIDYDKLYNEIFHILYNNNSYIKLNPYLTYDEEILDYDVFITYISNRGHLFKVTKEEMIHTKNFWKLMCKVELSIAEIYYFKSYFRTNIDAPNSQFSKEEEKFIIKCNGSINSFFRKKLCEVYKSSYCLMNDMIKKCRELNDNTTYKKLELF